MGAVAVIEAKELGAEAERKGFDLNPAPPADQKMAKLMKEPRSSRQKEKAKYTRRATKKM